MASSKTSSQNYAAGQHQQQQQHHFYFDDGQVKQITVFLNGDKNHCGKRLTINYCKYKTWNNILTLITQNLLPRFGAVRHIYSVNSSSSITSFEQFKPNSKYVACGFEKFRPIHNGYKTQQERKKNIRHPVIHYRPERLAEADKQWALDEALRNHRVIIYVFTNGKPKIPPHKFVLTHEDYSRWEFLLEHMSQALHIENGMRYLYTMDGDQVCGPWELQHGACYVAVDCRDQFQFFPYIDYYMRYCEKKLEMNSNATLYSMGAVANPVGPEGLKGKLSECIHESGVQTDSSLMKRAVQSLASTVIHMTDLDQMQSQMSDKSTISPLDAAKYSEMKTVIEDNLKEKQTRAAMEGRASVGQRGTSPTPTPGARLIKVPSAKSTPTMGQQQQQLQQRLAQHLDPQLKITHQKKMLTEDDVLDNMEEVRSGLTSEMMLNEGDKGQEWQNTKSTLATPTASTATSSIGMLTRVSSPEDFLGLQQVKPTDSTKEMGAAKPSWITMPRQLAESEDEGVVTFQGTFRGISTVSGFDLDQIMLPETDGLEEESNVPGTVYGPDQSGVEIRVSSVSGSTYGLDQLEAGGVPEKGQRGQGQTEDSAFSTGNRGSSMATAGASTSREMQDRISNGDTYGTNSIAGPTEPSMFGHTSLLDQTGMDSIRDAIQDQHYCTCNGVQSELQPCQCHQEDRLTGQPTSPSQQQPLQQSTTPKESGQRRSKSMSVILETYQDASSASKGFKIKISPSEQLNDPVLEIKGTNELSQVFIGMSSNHDAEVVALDRRKELKEAGKEESPDERPDSRMSIDSLERAGMMMDESSLENGYGGSREDKHPTSSSLEDRPSPVPEEDEEEDEPKLNEAIPWDIGSVLSHDSKGPDDAISRKLKEQEVEEEEEDKMREMEAKSGMVTSAAAVGSASAAGDNVEADFGMEGSRRSEDMRSQATEATVASFASSQHQQRQQQQQQQQQQQRSNTSQPQHQEQLGQSQSQPQPKTPPQPKTQQPKTQPQPQPQQKQHTSAKPTMVKQKKKTVEEVTDEDCPCVWPKEMRAAAAQAVIEGRSAGTQVTPASSQMAPPRAKQSKQRSPKAKTAVRPKSARGTPGSKKKVDSYHSGAESAEDDDSLQAERAAKKGPAKANARMAAPKRAEPKKLKPGDETICKCDSPSSEPSSPAKRKKPPQQKGGKSQATPPPPQPQSPSAAKTPRPAKKAAPAPRPKKGATASRATSPAPLAAKKPTPKKGVSRATSPSRPQPPKPKGGFTRSAMTSPLAGDYATTEEEEEEEAGYTTDLCDCSSLSVCEQTAAEIGKILASSKSSKRGKKRRERRRLLKLQQPPFRPAGINRCPARRLIPYVLPDVAKPANAAQAHRRSKRPAANRSPGKRSGKSKMGGASTSTSGPTSASRRSSAKRKGGASTSTSARTTSSRRSAAKRKGGASSPPTSASDSEKPSLKQVDTPSGQEELNRRLECLCE